MTDTEKAPKELTPFQRDSEVLYETIKIVFDTEILNQLQNLTEKYGNNFKNHPTGKEEFSQVMQESVVSVTSLLSKKYINKLKKEYLTSEGLDLFIFYQINHYVDDFIEYINSQ